MFDFLKKKERAEIARLQSEVERLSKYSKIADVDSEIDRRYKELAKEEAEHQQRLDDINNEIAKLNESYKRAKATYDELTARIEELNEINDYSTYEVSNPKYVLHGNNEYWSNLLSIRSKQKELISQEAISYFDWVGKQRLWRSDSELTEIYIKGKNITHNEARSLIDCLAKLMLRSFNSECNNLIASVTIHNYHSKKNGVWKVYESINNLVRKQHLSLRDELCNLKLEEIEIVYNHKLSLAKEKEEQAAIKELMREEEKARREYESEIRRAEKEERLYQKALLKAREDLQNEMGGDPIKMQEKIADLEERLREAMLSKERALSMAQQTKRGHVYVISNIGSFGDNVYKIGMTRRLEPFDRIDELGNASVPFKFDVHAMIYSEDAPSLEKALHNAFTDQRVNLINNRKEFFYTTIDEIEKVVTENHAQIEFTKMAKALQYRESVIMRKRIGIASESQKPEFPDELQPLISDGNL